MVDDPSPQFLRQELGARLRELRLNRNMTVEEVADRLLCSPSKISRLETGQRTASQRDVRDLCDIYAVTEAEQREELMSLGASAKPQRGRGLLGEGGGDPEYAGLENTATGITLFSASVIPTLFQTKKYGRAQLAGRYPDFTGELIEQRLRGFAIRQRLLTRKDPPRVTAVIDEAALHRQTGGADVMAEQLDRLVHVADLPNVEILVLPYTAGSYVAVDAGFVVLEFDDRLVPVVVYVEGVYGQRRIKRKNDIDRYLAVIAALRRVSLEPEESATFIGSIRGDYRT